MESFRCDQCFKTYAHEKALKSHIRYMHGEKFPCNLCSKKFKAPHLKRHIASEHTRKKTRYGCDVCKLQFYALEKYLRHFYAMHSEYVCDHCQRTFKRRETLIHHLRSVHGTRTYTCKQCKEEFKTRARLRTHNNNSHTANVYICDHCKEIYISKANIKRHFETICFPKKIVCDQCEDVFKTEYHLEIHVNDVHRRITFKCELCKRHFETNRNLTMHTARQHADSNEKLSCQKCGENFTSRHNLNNHVFTKHNDELIICMYCRTICSVTDIEKIITKENGITKYKCIHCHMTSENESILIYDSYKLSAPVARNVSRPVASRRNELYESDEVHSRQLSNVIQYRSPRRRLAIGRLEICATGAEETATKEALPPESLNTVYIKSEPPSTFEIKSEYSDVDIEPPDIGDSSVKDEMCIVLKQERDEDVEIGPEIFQKDKPESLSTGHIKSERPSTFTINPEYKNIKTEPPDIVVDSSVEENMCVVLKQEQDEDIDIGPEVLQKYDEPVNFKLKSQTGKNMYLIRKQDSRWFK